MRKPKQSKAMIINNNNNNISIIIIKACSFGRTKHDGARRRDGRAERSVYSWRAFSKTIVSAVAVLPANAGNDVF